ncbi:MAG: sialidase family protein [Verrucomicrobiales bacterium]
MNQPISRRNWTALTIGASAGLYVPAPAWAAPAAEILSTRWICPRDTYYQGWPTLTRLKNGDLIAVWSGRRQAHVCPFGSVEMMRSRDGGESWSYPRTVYDGPIDDRDAGILETAKGSLLVTSFTSLAYADRAKPGGKLESDPAWQAAHRRLPDDEARQAELGTWIYRSEDGGVSFSARIDSVVNSPHGPCQLADGRLLYLGKELWTEQKRIGAAESRDDGRTWKWLAEVPTREGDDFANYHELHAVECASGRIVAQIRNHNAANKGETLQSVSEDGGKSWSAPRSIGVWGLPSHLLRLGDDRLLMTYGHRRKPFGNQARLSEDEGETWSEPITISGDGAGGDLGYPSTVELEDGVFYTLWYEKPAESSIAQLRAARWRLAS